MTDNIIHAEPLSLEDLREKYRKDCAERGETPEQVIDEFEQFCGSKAYANLLRELHGIPTK